MAFNYRILKMLIYILLLLLFIILSVMLNNKLSGVAPVFHRGFFCKDESIMKPYNKVSTVPTKLLAALSVIIIILAIIGCELLKKSSAPHDPQNDKVHLVGKLRVQKWIYRIFSRLYIALIGMLMVIILVSVGKCMIGRLRPHFLAVCQPDYSKFNCSDGYITADVCTNKNTVTVTEARLSFPSGHAATASFTAVFVALYLQHTILLQNIPLVKPVVQYTLICLALVVGYTRISDYYHHWSDVLTGLLIGASSAVFVIYCMTYLHLERGPELVIDLEHQSLENVNEENAPEYQRLVQESS